MPASALASPCRGRRRTRVSKGGIGEVNDLSHERQIDRLEEMIHQLRVEFERFFNGALAVPPEELRNEVQRQLRLLRGANLRGVLDQFRLTGLEARYNSLSELCNRRLREHEEGRSVAVGASAPSRYDVSRGVLLSGTTEDRAVEALYVGLQRSPGDGPRFDLETFRTYIGKQIDSIRRKTGCSQVQFRLAEEDGKLKLKAKPVRVDRPAS